jgi:hypothetical protein
MIKFSKLLKESKSIEEIEDYLLNLNDIMGEPEKWTHNDKGFYIYEFEWDLGYDISIYNSVDKIEDIKKIAVFLQEIKTAQIRIEGYDLDFKISDNKFAVRITNKSSESENYNFIKRQNWREIELSYFEIVRFFKDKGYSVLKTEIEDDSETNDTASVYITTNATEDVKIEFRDLFLSEVGEKNKEDIIDRDIDCSIGTRIYIYPLDEKTYITI